MESCVWKEDDLRDFFMTPFQGGFVDHVQYVNSVSEHYTGNVVGFHCAYFIFVNVPGGILVWRCQILRSVSPLITLAQVKIKQHTPTPRQTQ